ncbi:MAG: hypothetical protein Q4G69_13640 [Planctomycetia bacterium]|nr:hypothetical protein [Planctomycetia bacterium]
MYKKFVLSILTLLFSLCVVSGLRAADHSKPVAVLSFAGYDQAWTAIQKIADQMGFGPVAASFRQTAGDIKGADRTKPFGAALFTNGKELIPFAFLPIEDLDKLEAPGIDQLKKQLDKSGDSYYFTTAKGVVLEIRQKAHWLYICEKGKASFLPKEDPSTFLKNRDKDAFVQGSIYVENIPKDLLEVLFASLRVQIAQADPASELQLKRASKYLNTLIDTLEVCSFASKIDPKTGKGSTEIALNAKEGSDPLKSWKASLEAKTKWNSLFQPKNAVLSFLQTQVQFGADKTYTLDSQEIMFDSLIQEIDKQIEGKEDQDRAKEIVNNLRKISMGALKKDAFSCAFTLTSEPMIFTGIDIAEGDLLKKTLRQIADYFALEYPDYIKKYVKIDAGNMNGWSVSTLTLPLEIIDASLPDWAAKLKISFLCGIQEDALVLFVGLDQKKVTEVFKNFAEKPFKEEKTPATCCVFSLKELGNAVDFLGSPSDFPPQFFKIRNILKSAPESAVCSISTRLNGNTLRQTRTSDGSVYKIIGQIVRVFTNPNQAKHTNDISEGEDLFDEPAPKKPDSKKEK